MTEHDEGKLLATVAQLSTAVAKLTTVVEKLEARQNYTSGAIAMFLLLVTALGVGIETAIQWFHK